MLRMYGCISAVKRLIRRTITGLPLLSGITNHTSSERSLFISSSLRVQKKCTDDPGRPGYPETSPVHNLASMKMPQTRDQNGFSPVPEYQIIFASIPASEQCCLQTRLSSDTSTLSFSLSRMISPSLLMFFRYRTRGVSGSRWIRPPHFLL
jgi:hypothetical protein